MARRALCHLGAAPEVQKHQEREVEKPQQCLCVCVHGRAPGAAAGDFLLQREQLKAVPAAQQSLRRGGTQKPNLVSTNHRIPGGVGLGGALKAVKFHISVEVPLPSAPRSFPRDVNELKTVSLLVVQRTDFSFPSQVLNVLLNGKNVKNQGTAFCF